ncbi:MAG: histidine--tRNA ligase [Patescibacteria group bacterium]|nr:histidine--tRNA ligase [Patescibacteria group bacterium]
MGRPKKTLKKPKLRVKKKLVEKVRGMHDILPSEMPYWDLFLDAVEKTTATFGFSKVETPILERTELFQRSTGENTDIVQKEMFSFLDKGGDDLTLRPEGTPGVVRAYIENGMHTYPQPVKLYYVGPMFRREKPQAGRQREFHQFNIEALGSSKPVIDAQVIFIAWKVLKKIGLNNFEVQINSVGCRVCREQYREMLVDFLSSKKQRLCIDCKKRLKKNPLRILDCKNSRCQEVVNEAPQIIDYLCDECHNHFKEVLEYLDEAKIPYNLNSKLVRGLDYYTKTAFEFWPTSEKASASQGSFGGGGRYDDLVEIMGGRETPAIGMALGVERIINYLKENRERKDLPRKKADIMLVQLGDMARKKALGIINTLMDNGIFVIENMHKDSIKSQLRYASNQGVRYALILGQKEVLDKSVLIRDMQSGIQEVLSQDNLAIEIKKKLNQKN